MYFWNKWRKRCLSTKVFLTKYLQGWSKSRDSKVGFGIEMYLPTYLRLHETIYVKRIFTDKKIFYQNKKKSSYEFGREEIYISIFLYVTISHSLEMEKRITKQQEQQQQYQIYIMYGLKVLTIFHVSLLIHLNSNSVEQI